MTSGIAVMFEFRCERCFQPQYASSDEASSVRNCTKCGQPTPVPEATPERIARAQNVDFEELEADRAGEPAVPPSAPPDDVWTDEQLDREARRQYSVDPSQIENMDGFASSRAKRFAGYLIDNLALLAAYVLGIAILVVLARLGLVAAEGSAQGASMVEGIAVLAVIYFPPLALLIIQWNMIASEGKSIGKKLLGMRIIRADGGNPGFMQGVVLRNWLRAALNLIPFFGLADALFIFNDSRRCIHDWIAGTHVIDSR